MRIFNSVFIVLFIAMLSLPLIFVDLSSDRVSVKENRMLAERPKLVDMKNHPVRFIRKFDAWFKDSTGFREQLVGLYRAINTNEWLNNQYAEGHLVFLIGEEGHHFVVRPGQLKKYQGKQQVLSNDQLQNMAGKLEEVNKYLDSKGIPLILMLCADKETIYSEYYPKSIKRGPFQLDMITDYLQEHTSVDVFNIKQALLAEKSRFLLFPLVDHISSSVDYAHYNQIGAFFAYRELMKHINIHFPEMTPYKLNDIEINYDEMGTPFVSLLAEIVHNKLKTTFFDDNTYLDHIPPEFEAFENNDQELPIILLIGDSYAGYQYIRKYIAQHFGKTIYIRWTGLNHLEVYINQYKPDIVVFESAERELGKFANSVIGIPKLP